MKNRDIVIRLRDFTSPLTWSQLKNLTKQDVIDNISPPLDSSELEQLEIWGKNAIEFLKNEWKEIEFLDLLDTHMRQSRIDLKTSDVAWMVTNKSFSEATAIDIYDRANALLNEEGV